MCPSMRLQALALLFAVVAAAPAFADAHYDAARARLEQRRHELAAEWRAAPAEERGQVIARGRAVLLEAFDRDLYPAWRGTRWDFYGATETPGEGTIACGYFVTTVVRDLGFRIPRTRLAQQASERIVKTLSPESRIRRFRHGRVDDVVAAVRAEGDGLYVVGMDYHVGFLRIRGERAELCHASFFAPQEVICEPAAGAQGFASRYHVVGPVFTDERVADWLAGRAVPMVG